MLLCVCGRARMRVHPAELALPLPLALRIYGCWQRAGKRVSGQREADWRGVGVVLGYQWQGGVGMPATKSVPAGPVSSKSLADKGKARAGAAADASDARSHKLTPSSPSAASSSSAPPTGSSKARGRGDNGGEDAAGEAGGRRDKGVMANRGASQESAGRGAGDGAGDGRRAGASRSRPPLGRTGGEEGGGVRPSSSGKAAGEAVATGSREATASGAEARPAQEARPPHHDRPRVCAEGKCREGGEEVGAHHQFPRRQTSTMRFTMRFTFREADISFLEKFAICNL